MASSVATPLEKQFATIAGVDVITSTSTQGRTSVTLEFAPDREIDKAAVDVQAALLRAQRNLPDRDDQPAVLPQGEPGRLADPLPHAHLALDGAVGAERFAENLIAPTHLDDRRAWRRST